MFAYVVRERASAPSLLRELAYSGHQPPPGPSADPAGWQACAAINVIGTVFGHREVNVVYRVSQYFVHDAVRAYYVCFLALPIHACRFINQAG